jgi:Family of unknown function (DUF6345)
MPTRPTRSAASAAHATKRSAGTSATGATPRSMTKGRKSSGKSPSALDTLPVFRLVSADVSTDRLLDMTKRVFDITDKFKLSELSGRIGLQAGSFQVELEQASGGIWAADQAQLFNPELRPKLLPRDKALAQAMKFVKSGDLLPKLTGGMEWGTPVLAGTKLATTVGTKRSDFDLDVQVVFPVTFKGIPMVGGGGDFTVVLGDGGVPIGFHGVWREVGDSFDAATIPQAQVEEEYLLQMKTNGVDVQKLSVKLAYYCAPGSEIQEFMYPVYVIGGSAKIGEELVPLRSTLVAATDFGPRVQLPEPEAKRPPTAKPPVTKMKERRRRTYANGTTHAVSHTRVNAATKPWEAGASWIGVSGGLPGSKKNAQGFIDGWAADGWIIDFNWGDANAFESDWRRNDDAWVDNADFVFYTGHANMNGWVLANPDDGFLSFTEIGANAQTPGDLWGQNDLEWVVVAACGPLQDNVISAGGGDVLGRWDGAFDGMHQLLGYGAITNDNEVEGKKLAQYCRDGQTVKDAWFRTAKEVQPATNGASAPDGPTVWVGVMWATTSVSNPINDHAWSHGSVASDPVSPTSFSCMWTVC